MTCAPVLMLGFNRPEFTRDLLACVRKARPRKLYFAVDGARQNRVGEAERVAEVQEIAKEVDWDCEVLTRFREQNLGCAQAIPDAISWFLLQESYGIILEDDVRPSEGFFRYETELLERYRDDTRVGMVSGFNHYGFQTNCNESYHFTNRCDIWGWGTWARVWKDYVSDVNVYLPMLDELLRNFTPNRRMRNMMNSYVRGVAANPNTWDVQLSLLIAAKGYLSAAPRKRMTANLGFGDERGVHTCGYCFDAVHYHDVWEGEPIVHPSAVKPDLCAIAKTERRMCGILPRAITFFGTKVPASRGICDKIGVIAESALPWLYRW